MKRKKKRSTAANNEKSSSTSNPNGTGGETTDEKSVEATKREIREALDLEVITNELLASRDALQECQNQSLLVAQYIGANLNAVKVVLDPDEWGDFLAGLELSPQAADEFVQLVDDSRAEELTRHMSTSDVKTEFERLQHRLRLDQNSQEKSGLS